MLGIFALLLMDWQPATPGAPLRQPQLAARGTEVALAYGAGNDVLVVTAVAAAGDLLAWRSTDGGRTWSAAHAINDGPGAAREGLSTLAADGRGRVFAAWLDLRGKGTRLYGAFSTDGGATWLPNVLVYESPGGTICQCCHPSATIADDGTIWVMWRNALGGSRDLYVTHSNDGAHFAAASKLGNGTWPLEACPMDGGGVAASRGRVVTAWRRESAIYVSEPGKPERNIGEGKDVTVASSAGKPVAAWSSGGSVREWREGMPVPATLAEHGAFPALIGLDDGTVLAAWEQDSGIRLERVP